MNKILQILLIILMIIIVFIGINFGIGGIIAFLYFAFNFSCMGCPSRSVGLLLSLVFILIGVLFFYLGRFLNKIINKQKK